MFIHENYQQVAFSEDDLHQKKVGLLATMFPASWRLPSARPDLPAPLSEPGFGNQTVRDTPMLLIVIYDQSKRAPASEGDILGIISLGCVLENIWLAAQSLDIGFQVLSALCISPAEDEVRRILEVPPHVKIAYGCRLGYPLSPPEAQIGLLGGTLVLGVLWGVWHLPQYYFAPEWAAQSGGLSPANIGVFLLVVLALAPIMTWIFNHTHGSILLAVLAHASVNTTLLVVVNQLFPSAANNPANALLGFGVVALALILVTRGRLGYPGEQALAPRVEEANRGLA